MSYRGFLLATVYGIAFCGWGAIWIAEQIQPLILVAVLGALAWGVVADRTGNHPLKPQWNRALLIIGLSLAGADWARGSGSWFLAIVLLMLYVSAVRALSPKANRDLQQMIGLSFLQLLAASVLTLSIGYAVFFLAFFFLTPWALYAVAVKAELEGEHDILRGRVAEPGPVTVPPAAGRTLSRGILASMTVALLMTMVVTLLFFVSFPRLSTGTFSGRLGLSTPVSGLSDQVQLGSMGTVLEDISPAARIVFESGEPPPPEQIYLRGIALNHFEDNTWTRRSRLKVLRHHRGHFRLPRDGVVEPTHRVRILLEDLGTDMLPVMPRALQLEVPRMRIRRGSMGTIYLPNTKGGIKYVVESTPADYRAPVDWAALAPFPELPAYMYRAFLPDGAMDNLPAKIRDAGKGQGNLQWVQAALDEFADYDYTLELPRGDDPLAAFLERRAGHCELFASALALMLRQNGIPAVVVNGFRGGEWLGDGDYFLVRQRNAHSWVEFYHPDLDRWLMLDPTPAAPGVSQTWKKLGEVWQRVADRVLFFWMDRIVAYDLQTQAAVVEGTRDQARQVGGALREWSAELRKLVAGLTGGLVWLGVGAMVAAVASLLFALAARRTGRRRRTGPVGTPDWMTRFLRSVRKAGIIVDDHTPLSIGFADPGLDPSLRRKLDNFCQSYYGWRFGHQGSEAELKQMARSLEQDLKRYASDRKNAA